MGELNWSLLQPVDVGAQVQQGFATGAAMVKHGQTRHALKEYLANPDDPKAFSALAYYDPQTAHNFQQQRLAQSKLKREDDERLLMQRLGGVAATDPAGARTQALQAGQLDLAEQFGKLDDASREKTTKFWTEAAPLAFKLRQIADPEQRKALFAQARPILEATGVNPAQLEQFDPTNDTALDAVIATGQKVSELVAQQKPQEFNVGPGEGRYARDPVTGKIVTIIAPNAGDQQFGAPVSGNAPTIGRSNNPGALRKPGSTEFQRFPTEQAGIAAQESQLGRYVSGAYSGKPISNVRDIVETYAPRKSRGGDNTDAQVDNYISYVSQRLGIEPGTSIDPANVPKLAAAMREFETGHRAKAVTAQHDEGGIREAAKRAIANGADPAQVRARAAAHGVVL